MCTRAFICVIVFSKECIVRKIFQYKSVTRVVYKQKITCFNYKIYIYKETQGSSIHHTITS